MGKIPVELGPVVVRGVREFCRVENRAFADATPLISTEVTEAEKTADPARRHVNRWDRECVV